MKKILGSAAALLAALLIGAAAAGAEEVPPLVPVLELPAPENGEMAVFGEEDPRIGPMETGYEFSEGQKTASSYADPSITVNVGRGRIHKTDYVYARVKIADPQQLRTQLASPLSSENTVLGASIAKRVQAVAAINGDFCGKQVRGTVIRQGEVLRLNCDSGSDVLVVDRSGDLHILEQAKEEDIRAMEGNILHAFTFGPGLIVNGEPRYGYTNRSIATHKAAQRAAFCQTGPLEYLLIISEGPEDPGSTGLKLDQFVELLACFPEIQNAYNLDGGSCATLIFRKGSNSWAKINSPRNGKSRTLKDIIYFADAWMPEPEPTETPVPEPNPEAQEAP